MAAPGKKTAQELVAAQWERIRRQTRREFAKDKAEIERKALDRLLAMEDPNVLAYAQEDIAINLDIAERPWAYDWATYWWLEP